MTTQSTTTKEALEPCCNEWPTQSAIIDSYIKFQSARSGQDTFKLAGGVSFRFCPWCGKARSGVSAPIVAPAVDANFGLQIWNGTWPIRDVLTRLADAVEHLLQDHDCDMHGYEGLSFAIPAARWYAEYAAPASPAALRDEADELVDEVQHRMDQVVEAAVEWHQAGQEGAEWFEAAEKLGAAINSLLELRGDPNNMPRRWCSVHNCEEFKYESLEHELRSKTQDEAETAAIRKGLEREVATNRFIDQLLRERADLRKSVKANSDLGHVISAMADVLSIGEVTSTEEGNNSHVVIPMDVFDNLAKVHRELTERIPGAATTPPSTLARKAAEEIHRLCDKLAPDIPNDSTSYAPTVEQIAAIIERCLAGGE